MAKVITIYNHKGGSGKTLITVNLAASLAARKYRTLIIDNDGQSNASCRLGFYDRAFNMSGIFNQNLLELPIEEVPGINNLWLAPGSESLDRLGFELYKDPDAVKLYYLLDNAVRKVDDKFDFIIIDTPPSSASPLVYNSLVACDKVIVPIDSDGPNAFEGIKTVFPFISEIRGLNPRIEFMGVIINRYSDDFSSKQTEAELKAFFKNNPRGLFKTKIWDYKNFKRAQWEDKPVNSYAPGSEAAQNFLEFSKEVTRLT